MIKCPKCGSDNLLGALFCRNCGGKLNINELRPETENQRRQHQGVRVGRILYRLVVLAVLAAVVGVLVGLFLAPTLRPQSALSDAEQAAAEKKFQSLSNVTPLRQVEAVSFSAAEVTALANKHLLGGKLEGNADAMVLAPEQITVDLLPSGYMLVVLKSKLMGKVPVYSSMVAGISGSDSEIAVSVLKVNAGRIPLPQAAWPFVLQRIDPVFRDSQDLARLRKDISAVEIGDNSATVRLKPVKTRLKNALSNASK